MGYLQQLLPAYTAYLIATASPGPSNMAIMGVAMSQGRSRAMMLALGVVTGSMLWAIVAGTGIAAILTKYAEALLIIKLVGGFYLLFLAFKAGKSALSTEPAPLRGAGEIVSFFSLYRHGVLLHLTNPKAVLAWVAIMSLGLAPGAPKYIIQIVIAGCAALGVLVFCGYAMIFSTISMVRAYQKARRWIEATLSVFFAFAGIRLLMSKT